MGLQTPFVNRSLHILLISNHPNASVQVMEGVTSHFSHFQSEAS